MIPDIFVENGRERYHKGVYIEGEKSVENHLETIDRVFKLNGIM